MTQAAGEAGFSQAFLSTEAATSSEKRLARIIVVFSLLGFAVGVPFLRRVVAEEPAFIPAYEGALWVIDTLTAVLLFGQFARLRSQALLILASGYLFDGLMVISHALPFPGVFSVEGLISGGPQTTAWLYMFWHFGFPAFVLAFALLNRRKQDVSIGHPATAVAIAVCSVVALVATLTLAATAGTTTGFRSSFREPTTR